MLLALQFAFTLFVFLFSAIVSWYEGSEILNQPWEWPYSTPFSHMLYGEVLSERDISQLDHFIYAAKFKPAFPAVMAVSGLYLLILVGYYFLLLRQKQSKFFYFLFVIGGGLLFISCIFTNSPTKGGEIFHYIWLAGGLICILAAIYIRFLIMRSKQTI